MNESVLRGERIDIDIAIVIVSWNVAPLLANCLRSIPAGAAGLRYQVMVVDNASTDGSADMVAQDFPAVQLLRNRENLGFAKANNQAIKAMTLLPDEEQARYVVLLNSDTVVCPGALRALVRFMDAHPQVGVVGPRLLCSNGVPQPYAFGRDPSPPYLLLRGLVRIVLRRYLHNWATAHVHAVDWVSGACLVARRAPIAQIGPLDENIFMYFEDNDWCLRMRNAGWKVYYNPQAEVIHLGGQSLAQNPAARQSYYRSLEYFYAKHYGRLASGVLKGLLMVYRRIAHT